ncbi:MAG: GHKL domain-containing protein [Calditrichales bacterium]|nr:MAG: GHKL domain-containing protein [Calditrichales bacterium]
MSFCILIPYYKKSGENANSTGDPLQKTVSLIGYVIDFELLVEVFIQPIKLSKDDFAWAMDGNGRLIYHPKHRTMLLRTIERLEKDCMECHASFELQKKITMEPASFGEYKIGTEPTKIMAAVPIELHNEKWILVITSVLPQVTENLRNNFRNFFILGMIILIAILSFGLTLYYVNTRRIRAEESNRQAENMQILQEQLNQSTKLASVGELVDTVAHEINTPVGIISAQADAMFLQGEISDRFAEEITIIKQQIRRISKYTRSLLGYSRRAVFAPNPNDIVELLEECLYLLGHRFRAHDIIITREFSSSLPKTLMDRGQMEQVFINLLNNAIDAIDQKGKIQIKVYIQNGIDQHTSANGLAIEIADNGKGISTQEKDKIFSAFYTSKKPSQGTGLGLYISKSIIQRHQGIISFSENQPTGTIFKIYLPFNQDRSI